jgi:tripeptide aminopeptidase
MKTPADSVSLLLELLRLPGGSGQEGAVAEFVKSALRGAGVPASAMVHDRAHTRSPLGGALGNLIVKLPGTVKAPRRLLMAHMDTVPLCRGAVPELKGSVIRPKPPQSKGAAKTALGGDNRSGVGVVLHTALTILKNKLPHPPLTLFFAVQEEVGLMGARFADVKLLGNPALCFNWDGGAPGKLTIGATGAYRLYIDVHGLASHAGLHPERGVSAVTIAALAIADLQLNGWHGLVEKGRRMGTSNIGVVLGGEATNVVTDYLKVTAEARSHDPAFRKTIVDAFKKAFEKAASAVRSSDCKCGRVDFKADLHYESFRLKPDAPCVRAAAEAVRDAGLEPEFAIANGGLDANWLTRHGFPTVSMGAGQRDVHTVKETLFVPSYLQACGVALRLATDVAV